MKTPSRKSKKGNVSDPLDDTLDDNEVFSMGEDRQTTKVEVVGEESGK